MCAEGNDWPFLEGNASMKKDHQAELLKKQVISDISD
jgi:hypothetical protein